MQTKKTWEGELFGTRGRLRTDRWYILERFPGHEDRYETSSDWTTTRTNLIA